MKGTIFYLLVAGPHLHKKSADNMLLDWENKDERRRERKRETEEGPGGKEEVRSNVLVNKAKNVHKLRPLVNSHKPPKHILRWIGG